MKIPSIFKVEVSEEEFMRYYYKYRLLVYSIIREFKLNSDLVEDIALSIFSRFPSILEKYDPSRASFSTYLGMVTKSTVIHALTHSDYYETHRVLFFDDELEKLLDIDYSTKYKFKIEHLKDMITEDEYDLIYSIYVLNYKLKEYALLRGMGYSTVRKKHTLLIKKIRKKIYDFL